MSRKKDELNQRDTIDNTKEAPLTTNQGLPVSEDEFSLKAGERGPTLMEDFHFREKMTHFDHERIPERIVHARGFAVHGEFEVYESLEKYTRAKFLTEPGKKTPVFTRFSTVAGNRGSMDIPRDVRGFATKFYTEEGNFDLVANNMPVFFMQDAIKFPDFVHAVKPEPHNEIPQAASAHNTFWDWVSENTESAHMVMWLMSDRAIPRSLAMMEGFGVHTFRLVNAEGKSHFVKFHWKPKFGTHQVLWDEAQMINGKNIDFNRMELWQNIEKGIPAEFELGLQVIPEEDEFEMEFDILDPTKLWPEEEVPVQIVGKMTLNQNVDNYFAETEQVAFHPGHVVPGIDFSNDPLLQGRLFSYTDTQLIRLGGPNFHQIPINRPVCPFANNQRDGYNQMYIHKGETSYSNNTINNNQPEPLAPEKGGYEHYSEKVEGRKVRARSDSFKDHFSQAKLFLNSMSETERQHIYDALSFELGKCDMEIRENAIYKLLNKIDRDMTEYVADRVGVEAPSEVEESTYSKRSPALSMENTEFSLETRTVGVMLTPDVAEQTLKETKSKLEEQGLQVTFISDKIYKIGDITLDETFDTVHCVLFDSMILLKGEEKPPAPVIENLEIAYKHKKAIGYGIDSGDIFDMLSFTKDDKGVADIEKDLDGFLEAVKGHRVWDR
ncbi:catalase [Salinicoccus roseus]|uniref:Catalase n=1 Tax=Salinicoccus roseus TaxID=45670 RepID=A0A0C2H9R9_9STAP|nr:catalase [Salinicoccus roseus]KIH70545.1 catalase [Salinicoccus roseus]MDB0580636.1 catalase [Salinicoccus roseus]RPE52773.1 catalase [Salinicoccus roseus]GGA73554.1 catalase HPII [Salinicoccus roseus]